MASIDSKAYDSPTHTRNTDYDDDGSAFSKYNPYHYKDGWDYYAGVVQDFKFWLLWMSLIVSRFPC